MLSELLKYLTWGDRLLIIALAGLSVGSSVLMQMPGLDGKIAVISVRGEEVQQIPLNSEKQLEIQGAIGPLVVQVLDGAVWVVSVTCPNKLCQRQGRISRAGEIIVCAPNRVLISIEGEATNQFDGITG